MLSTTIASGGGTTSLVLNANAGQTITSLGATIMFDDGPNLLAAAAACVAGSSLGGAVLISPSTTTISFPGYIFNSPITFPEQVNLIFACHCIINETMTFHAGNRISSQFGATGTDSPQFGNENYCDIVGIGNPMMSWGEDNGNSGSIFIEDINFTNSTNGTCALELRSAFYCGIYNCGFKAATNYGTAVGVIFLGSCSNLDIEDTAMGYSNRFFGPNGGNTVNGQSAWGPPIPGMWFRGSNNSHIPNYNFNTGQVKFGGKHSWTGRGVLFDQLYSGGDATCIEIEIGDLIWNQQATTPTFMFWGSVFNSVSIKNILNDTSQEAALANWATSLSDVDMSGCSTSLNGPVVTGNPVIRLSCTGSTSQYQAQLQRITLASFTSSSSTTDTVSIPNYPGYGSISLTPINASAALDIAAGLCYITGVSNGIITVSHSATAGMIFDLMATVGN